MRIHALESSAGLTYAEMGRFVSADDPTNPAGTNDDAAAAKDESGKPVSSHRPNTWVTETALATALNMSYMATGVSIFAIVVGVALILAGVGFMLLAFAVFRGSRPKTGVAGNFIDHCATPRTSRSRLPHRRHV